MMGHAHEDALGALMVAAVTGVRRGELFALRWADIDFARRTIRVDEQNDGGRVTDGAKTEAGERFVPMFEAARKALLARKLASRYGRPQDLVFCTTVGTPIDPGNFARREYKRAQQQAGLGEWVVKNGTRRWAARYRFHDLRHYAVSALIEQGADIKLLQRIAGHANASVTLDVYGHLMTDRITEAATMYDPQPGKLRPRGRWMVDGSDFSASSEGS
jgi:integrase